MQGGGLYCAGNSNPGISQCHFVGNASTAENGGACSIRDSRPTISDSVFTANTSIWAGGAIFVRGSRFAVIAPGNTFDGNRGCGGNDLAAWSIESTPLNATANDFAGSADSEAYVLPAGAFDTTGHTSALQPIDADLFVAADGDDALNTGLSPGSPFRTIRHALEVIRTSSAQDNLSIHVAPGMYSSALTGEHFPLPLLSGIRIQGAGSDATALNSDNAFGCFRCELSTDTALHNLALTGARGPGFFARESVALCSNLLIADFGATPTGAGVQLASNANVQFSDCIISGNHASVSGGGLHLATAAASFTDCQFIQNTADYFGGAVYVQSGSGVFTGCEFSGNSARTGGAVRVDGGSPNLSGVPGNPNVFQGNSGSRGANLSATRVPAIPYAATGNVFDVAPESAWSVSPAGAFDCSDATFTEPPLLQSATVYVAIDGDDVNDGLTPTTALRTISKAMRRVSGTPDGQASIVIAQGIFSAGESFPLPVPPYTGIYGAGMDLTRIESPERTVLDYYFSTGSSATEVEISSEAAPGITVESCDPDFMSVSLRDCMSFVNGGGMALIAASPTVTDCRFTGNTTSRQGGAIHCGSGSAPAITGCVFDANQAGQYGGGILSGYGAHPCISECEFFDNVALQHGGAVAAFFGAVTIGGSSFSGNGAFRTGGAVYLSEASADLASGAPNFFDANVAAAGADLAADTALDDPVDARNSIFSGIPESEFYVAPQRSFNVVGCSGAVPILRDIYIAPWGDDNNSGVSPLTPLRTIRHGLSRIGSRLTAKAVTVHLAAGTYPLSKEPWPHTLPLLSGVTIRGMSQESVIIDANGVEGAWIGLWNDNSALQRVTITRSAAPAVELIFCKMRVSDCIFTANQVGTNGGAIATSGGLLTIVRSEFSGNHAGGSGGAIDVRQFGALLMTGCTFIANSAGNQGGAVSTWLAGGRAHGCVFIGNTAETGGAWSSRQDRSMTVTGSRFENNSAGSGGGIAVVEGRFDTIDCLLAGNEAAPVSEFSGYGGGISLEGCASRIDSCSIVNNTASGFSRIAGGGIALLGGASVAMTDSIIWSNTAPVGADIALLWRWNPSDAGMAYSVAGAGTSESVHISAGSVIDYGAGMLFEDPLFVDMSGDWRLSAVRSGQSVDSPCIDAGSELARNASYLTLGGVVYMRNRTVESGGWLDEGMLDMGWHTAGAFQLTMVNEQLTIDNRKADPPPVVN